VTGHCGGVGPTETKEDTFKAQLSEKNKDDIGTLGPGNCDMLDINMHKNVLLSEISL
jgi:hypothetical protein